MDASLKMPGIRINRADYLKAQLSKHCPKEQVEKAISETPMMAKISTSTLKYISNGCIKYHRNKIMALSFVAGLPGGWWMAASIPADLVQFYYNCIQLAQKLAYLYGWSDLFGDDELVDDNTKMELTLFIGAMMGSNEAVKVINKMALQVADQAVKRIPQKALTKYALYNIIKKIGKWVGIRITKQTFAKGVGKVIPVVGGLTSSGIAYFFYMPMAIRLNKHLSALPIARGYDENNSDNISHG